MGATYACQNPHKVKKLVLLAPALIWPDLANDPPEAIDIPVVLYHGSRDQIIPIQPVRQLADQIFMNLDFREVDDDHGMYKTVHEIDWTSLLDTPDE
jgi:predicted esterase